MSGRAPVKFYQYDKEGKYIKTFQAQVEIFNQYFNGKKGRLIEENNIIRELPDGTFVTKERLGREGFIKEYKIYNSKFCKFTNSRNKDKSFSIFNLKNDKLASFANIQTCVALTGFTPGRIRSSLLHNNNWAELIFKYD